MKRFIYSLLFIFFIISLCFSINKILDYNKNNINKDKNKIKIINNKINNINKKIITAEDTINSDKNSIGVEKSKELETWEKELQRVKTISR